VHRRESLQLEKGRFKECRQQKERILDQLEECGETKEQLGEDLKRLQAEKQRMEGSIQELRGRGKGLEGEQDELLASLEKCKVRGLEGFRKKRLLDERKQDMELAVLASKERLQGLREECMAAQEYTSQLDEGLSHKQHRLNKLTLQIEQAAEAATLQERELILERERLRDLQR
jgi:hypothetical protein